MADPNLSWLYLVVFLAIPLARIIPRLVARYRGQEGPARAGLAGTGPAGRPPPGRPSPQAPEPAREAPEPVRKAPGRERARETEPQTDEQRVLREMHRGARTFEALLKHTGLEAGRLESVLGEMERGGLMRVVTRRGLLGSRVELHPTDKGFREYYS